MSSTKKILFSGIRDNRDRGTVADFLRQEVQAGSRLSIVSAYFTIYAFDKLKDQLTEIESLNFLFGEPRFIKSLDPEKTDKKVFDIEDQGLQLQTKGLTQKPIAKACAKWIAEKVQIKSIRQANLLHGKMYHIAHNATEKAILGSSNFTVKGLGLGSTGNNIELNLEIDSNRDREDLKSWFYEIWNDDELVEDVKQEVLQYLEMLYSDNAPEFVYFKTLFHLFNQFLVDQDASDLLSRQNQLVDTKIWNMLFDFQKDGVKGAIIKIQKHNGCIIADSVGLGKTFEALAIIKYFELLNYKVLVLCPKKLRQNWTTYQAQNNSELNPLVEDRFCYTVLSHTDLSRDSGYTDSINLETINWGNYDLLVIDESHNFRNNTKGKRDEDGNIIKQSRYEKLVEKVLKEGLRTKVLLLSATPVNNDLKDLRNQIYFLTEGKNDSFKESMGIANLESTLENAQKRFTTWSKTEDRQAKDLLDNLDSDFFKLLDELTIARSRQHIKKYYKKTLDAIGQFPIRPQPISVFPEIDIDESFMDYEKLNEEISGYKLSLFNPSRYVLPEYIDQYENSKSAKNFKQSDRENYLIAMMKVNFLKRLESSVHSFAVTTKRTIDKIKDLVDRIKKFQQYQSDNPDLDFDDLEIRDIDDEELQNALQVGKKLKFKMAHLDLEKWLQDLKQDKQQLNILYTSASAVTADRDAKLRDLRNLIYEKVKNPLINKHGEPNRKVLIFTAFADTAAYLYQNLASWASDELDIHTALVVGSGENKTTFGNNNYDQILTNFAPRAKKRDKIASMPQDAEIDLLIATDCISEGQNLQDCDYLVNYDIHWNPVRLVQRFGRIDRIGSPNESVQMVNFWITDLDKYINLKNRVEARMALVDITATGNDNLLSSDAESLIAEELKYRDRQLLRLKDEVLDLEDFSESVALNEFTLDDFRIELTNYIENNRRALSEAPFGIYAVVPIHPDYKQIGAGTIFCLRQKGDSTGNEKINPLQPYFLVYVRDDHVVRYGFAQPKQILEIYRLLCSGKSTPYEELCRIFDAKTQDGQDMSVYDALLKDGIASIVSSFKRRSHHSLQSGRGGRLPPQSKQIGAATDFELITWLVIGDE